MAYVLVGDAGTTDEPSVLSKSESKTLKNALWLDRSEDKEAAAITFALRACTETSCAERGVLRRFLDALMSDLGEHSDEIQGMLVEQFEQPILMLEEKGTEQIANLKGFLKVLQADGWLGNFLDVRIQKYAEKPPTPLQFMRTLTEEASNFESDLYHAKRMIQAWPQFFAEQRPARRYLGRCGS